MRVLFAAAELAPVIRVGGLAEAAGGLVSKLREMGVDVDVVLPDYGGIELANEKKESITVPGWAGPMWARTGSHATAGKLTLLGSRQLEKPSPYVDQSGEAWPDNDLRFMQFSAAIAAHRDATEPDVVHLNDYHSAAAIAMGVEPAPTVLTIHTLGYQGVAPARWLKQIERGAEDFAWYGQINPLAGAINQADRVIAVSPNYSQEILREESGMGMHNLLAAKGDNLVGILNGIDAYDWNPATDRSIAEPFDADSVEKRDASRSLLLDIAGWEGKDAIVGVVTRLVDQKGIDLLLGTVPYLSGLPARIFILGSGLERLADPLHAAVATSPDRVYFHDGYDLDLAHRIFAGSDMYAMPSRFEPCGLAQMQAMRYGSVPVVTPVGGLVDTVLDADDSRKGTGFVARGLSEAGLVDALHRACRARKNRQRWAGIQSRGMRHDWSWEAPADRHLQLYREIAR
ncbi:MAG: glycosyltransferase [Acidimicrobiia bacterium]|nr:glycosyltransferase [Acidimicrobiia bacterium]